MTNLLKNKIIFDAWNMIKDDSKIKKIYFLPWLLSIIFLTFLLVYQSIYTYVVVFWKKEEALVIILNFFHSAYITETLITFWIFLIIYFLLTPIFEWWLIKYIDSKNNNMQLWTSQIISAWIYNFIPVFEYDNIFSEFKFISILNFFLFTIRFVWIEYVEIISYVYLALFFVWTIINLLCVYPKYEIVINNKWIFESIWISSKIAILNFETTFKLYFLLFILNIRVFINFIIFLSFPIIIVFTIGLITSKIFLIVAIIIQVTLFVFFILILWYLTWVLEIFTKAVWYFAYIEWKEQLEKLNLK